MADTGTIRIKWVRSGIGFHRAQSEVIRSLGLRRLNQVVERPDVPQIRGLAAKVAHLVEILPAAEKSDCRAVPEYVVHAEPAPVPEAPSPTEATENAPDSAGSGERGVSGEGGAP